MANLTAKQASDLANDFLGLAQAIGDFRYDHWHTLSKAENQKLADRQWSVLNYGEDISALSTTLVLEDVTETLAKINSVTQRIRKAIHQLDDIKKAINVATAIMALGGAIISKNPQAIQDGILDVIGKWKDNPDK